MSKEVIRSTQFAKADPALLALGDHELHLNKEQQQEMSDLYTGIFSTIQPGKLITGTVVRVDSDGVLVDIGYKSDGLIPRYEFSTHELKSFKPTDPIEVILDQLESIEGNVVLSYEKAKALKAWDTVTKLFEEDKPVEGMVTHKVKGGLNVDIGIPAFLPGSQIDLQ
ncbi:MAG TPA: S1 RNA-binding domain-containing protein, partial [Candidatus Limnocylindria bacterium]|nr:S1 RNA-binding domain-containing protein [Candidatus Limnocylindria bacterium]